MRTVRRSLRGLRDLRTLAGQADEASLPHRAYMKLACLEMEKARRRIERSSALQRLHTIDARIRDIETEQAAIRQAMGGAAACASDVPEPGPHGGRRSFRVRY
jgi:hypothetical protein